MTIDPVLKKDLHQILWFPLKIIDKAIKNQDFITCRVEGKW